LIDHMRRHGKDPVWAAIASNAASLAFAGSLGFTPVDRLAVLTKEAIPSPFGRGRG
jgi:hypothetical protein